MLKFTQAFLCLLLLTVTTNAQTLCTANFGSEIDDWFIFDIDLDGEREILTFHEVKGDKRPFAIATKVGKQYAIEQGAIRRDVVAMAVGEFGFGVGQQIALISPDQVTFMGWNKDKKIQTFKTKLPFRCIIRSPLSGPPSFWHWATDIDGDGRDDLFLPGEDGIVVFYGDGKGGFSNGQTLQFSSSRTIETDTTGHLDFEQSYSRPVLRDINNDKLVDLCWFDERGLSFIPQKPARNFDLKNKKSFDLEWLTSSATGGILEDTDVKLKDLNGDNLPDLFLSKMSTPASGITDMRTTLVVLLNQGNGQFLKRPDFALRVGGIIGNGPDLVDINKDGHADLVFGSYGTSMADAMQRMMGNIQVKFNIYLGRKNAKAPFNPQPDFSQDYRVPKKDYEKWGVRNNFALEEDLNADGIADLFTMMPEGGGHKFSAFAGKKTKDFKVQFDTSPFLEVTESDVSTVTFRTMSDKQPICVVIIKKSAIVVVNLK